MVDLVIQAFKILMFEFTSSKLSEKMHESILGTGGYLIIKKKDAALFLT
jgi:hypothetical protein